MTGTEFLAIAAAVGMVASFGAGFYLGHRGFQGVKSDVADVNKITLHNVTPEDIAKAIKSAGTNATN